MLPEDKVRLRHLTEAATRAVAYSAGRTRADLDVTRLDPGAPVIVV